MNMKKNNLGVILTASVLISFTSGGLGALLIYGNNHMTTKNDTNIIENKKGITVNEQDSISKGVEVVYDAVVVVEGFNKNNLASTGTGFVYKENNGKAYIMTNHHVVSGIEKIKVIMSDKSVVDAELIGSEAYSDIAVLAVDTSKVKDIAIMGSSSKLSVGDTVFTVGSPSGADYAGTVTKGILSGKDRMVEVTLSQNAQSNYFMRVLQTDAPINPGNSGGPICNINGEVIGVTNMKLVDSTVEGMGFAIPIEDALNYANALETGKGIKRPYVGIGMLDVTDEFVLWQNGITLDKNIDMGVVIISVEKKSPADKAGLKKGDVIISLGGEKTKSIAELRFQLHKYSPNDEVVVEYVRDSKIKKTKIRLAESKVE